MRACVCVCVCWSSQSWRGEDTNVEILSISELLAAHHEYEVILGVEPRLKRYEGDVSYT